MKTQTINKYLIFLITGAVAFSQAVTVKGFVIDSSNKKPLVGANVYIAGTSMGTSTSDEGRYNIANVSPGTYTLKASYIGYESKEMEITVKAGEELAQDFELEYVTIEGKAIEVTAQARGQMDAINKQLKAKSIKNIISSDRIQELPDANAAEAVARVPGVSIRREGGEGNKVVIRGLSPKYNKITVNGTNLASTDADDRSTDLSMISQYMLEGIEVTKAGTPDQEADVLGGTVNFKLKKAPSGLHGNLVTQGMYNSLRKTQDDYKLVFDISNRFFNDKLGILGQIDLENRNRSSHNLAANYVNTPADLDTINSLTLETLTLTDIARQNNRDNNLFVIDYNFPNGNISYSGLHSTIDKDITTYANVYPLQTPDGQRNFDTGELLNRIQVTTETWKYEQQLSPDLKLDLFKSFSKSTNGDTNKVYNFRETAAYTMDVGNKSVDNIQDFTVNDTNATWFDRYDYNEFSTAETEHAFGGNMEFDLKINNQISGKVKFGFKNRDKTREHDRDYEYAAFTYVGMTDKRDTTYQMFEFLNSIPNGTKYAPYYAFMDRDYDDEGFLDGKYTLGPFADIDNMNQLFSYFRANWNWDPYHENIMHHFHKTQSLIYDYSGTEEYNGRYIMTDLNIGRKLNIVTGVRLEDNITRYTSYHGQQTTLPHYNSMGSDTVSNHTRKNSYTLPSLFLKYQPEDWLILRYASTKTLTRPNYSDIIPLYNINGGSRAVEYRNPYLEPGISDNNDYVVSFNNKHLGLLSFSYFSKEIEGLIFSSGQRYITDPSLYGLPGFTEKYRINDYKANNPYIVDLSGFEIDYQTRFWYLPKLLRGLVFNANYTRTTSEVKYPRTVIETKVIFDPSFQVVTNNLDSLYVDRLLDQPEDIINLSLGYDYKGFSGRLSMNYISNVFSTTNFWPGLREDTDAYRRYDLSMKQKLPIKGLELYLNISNLTEAVDITRLRGYNPYDPDFDKSIYDEILDPSLFSYFDPTGGDDGSGERVGLNPDIAELLGRVPRDQRAKSQEQHYGSTIDIGFRFAF
ncbi:MAG: TonB-dependent receptor [Candidatus Neomarinimicrobiota bacterium]|tara:strand:- start:5200 stop:8277 length:3078 start_codon:yes stop_codon:yes gene_type:complete